MLSQVSVVRSEKSELTYKNLPDRVTYIITTALHISIIVLAIFIPNVDITFEIVGSIACPMITFVIPAAAFI